MKSGLQVSRGRWAGSFQTSKHPTRATTWTKEATFWGTGRPESFCSFT